jgi:double zinc ribbon protein
MKCELCQHENQPGAEFCQECSASLARVCSNCGPREILFRVHSSRRPDGERTRSVRLARQLYP